MPSRNKSRKHAEKAAPDPVAPVPPPSPAEPGSWARGWRVPLALGVLHLVLALLAFNPAPHPGGDNAAYVALARSLLDRGEYRELWDPSLRPHTQYPPVFPLILALGMLAGLEPWIGPKLIVLAFSVAAVVLSYLWLRRVSTPGVALGAGFFLAFSPGVLVLAHWELSDVPFWAFGMLALWAFAHVERAPGASTEGAGDADGPREGRWIVLAAVATALAYFTRSAGLPLVAAAVLWLAWRRRWRSLAAFCAIVGPLALAWWLRGRLVVGPGYLDDFWLVNPYNPAEGRVGAVGLLTRIVTNGKEYLTLHFPTLMFDGTVGVYFTISIIALALAGWARRLRRAGVAELWLPLYVGLVLVWPNAWASERLVLPIVALLLLYAGESVRDWVGESRGAWAWGAVTAAALYVVAVPGMVTEIRAGTQCTAAYLDGARYACTEREWRDFFVLNERMRGQLPPGSVVIARKPTLTYALSGYPSRVYPESADPAEFLRTAREAGATYVIVDRLTGLAVRYLYPVLRERPDAFLREPAFREENAYLLRIKPAALLERGTAPAPRFERAPAPPARDSANR